MDITIRPATLADLPSLRQFERLLIKHEGTLVPNLRQEGAVLYYRFDELLVGEDATILLAEADQTLVGCGLALIQKNKSFYVDPQQGYLGLLYVNEEYRGNGISTGIILRLIDWCHEKRLSDIRLEVYAKNVNAVRLYEKLGFEPFVIEMKLIV